MKEGIVNILKPPGMTSSDVVADARHIFSTKRIGHTGTLDPGASGVLPIGIGRATRLFDYLVEKDKEYIAELRFGAETDTEDAYGKVISTSDTEVSEEELFSVLPRFRGDIEQIAPMYSAVRVDGKKLYELARQGAERIERVRSATVHELELLRKTGEGRFMIRMVCSRGTYVRTVCADIGRALGKRAYMAFLLRTRAGNFAVADAYTLNELREMKEQDTLDSAVIPCDEALTMLRSLTLDALSERDYRLLTNGAPIEHALLGEYGEGEEVKVYANGAFVGVGKVESGMLHIKLFLMESQVS